MREGPLAALDAIEQGDRREARSTPSAIASAARCCAITLAYHGGEGRRPRRVGDLVRRAGRLHLCRRPQGVRRRGAASQQLEAHMKRAAAISKARKHGERLQHAALQRPDLALRRQQLSQGQGALPVRPAVLEFGFRPACRRPTTRSICATATSRTSSTKGEMEIAGVHARSRQGHDPDLQSGDARGPHRAGEIGVRRLASFSAAR